jgi:PAS domain S-box-containing protein
VDAVMLGSLWNSRYVAACICDLRGQVLYVNDAACGLLGQARESLVGLSIYDLTDYDLTERSSHLFDAHQTLLSYAKAEKSTAELVQIMSKRDAANSNMQHFPWQIGSEDVAEAEVVLELHTSRGTLVTEAEVTCQQTARGEVFLTHLMPVPAHQPTSSTPSQPAATPLTTPPDNPVNNSAVNNSAVNNSTNHTSNTSSEAKPEADYEEDYYNSVRQWLDSVPEVFHSLLPGAIALVDRDGVYHDVKQAPGFVAQVPAEQCIGKTFEEVLPADMAAERRRAIEHAFRTKQPYYFVSSQLTPEGRHYYEVRYSYLDEQFCVGVKYDITEKYQLEQRLAASQARAQSMLAAIADGVITISRAGIFLSIQAPKDFQFEHPVSAFIGKHLDDVPEVADIREAIRHYVSQTLDSKKQHTHSYEIAINGKTHYRDLRFSYLDDDTCLILVRDVSEWLNVAMYLQDVQTRFDQFMRVSDDIFAIIDIKEEKLKYINPSYQRLTDYSPQVMFADMNNMGFLQTIDPRDHSRIYQLRDALQQGRDMALEFRLLCRDGSTRWLLLRCRVVVGGQTAMCVATDISELKRSQHKLTASRDHLHRLYTAFPDAIMRFNHEGVCLDVKLPSYENINSDMPASAMIGKMLDEVAPAEAVPVLQAHLAKTLETGRPQQCEYNLQHQGRTFYREARFVPLENAEVLTIIRDISNERRVEGQLARRERQLQGIFDVLPSSISRYDRRGVCLEHKPARYFQSLSPHADAGLVGKTLADIAHPDARDTVTAYFEALLASNQPQTFDYGLEQAGRLVYREATMLPLGDDEVLTVIRDVSEQRRIEQRLIEREQHTNALFEALPDGVIHLDADGVYLGIKMPRTFEATIPIDPETTIGKTLEQVLPAETAATLRHHFNLTLQTGKMQVFDYTLPTVAQTAGQTAGVNIREIHLVKLREGEVLGVVRDVSEQRQGKLELQARTDHLQALFDALPDSAAHLSRDGVYLGMHIAPDFEPALPAGHFLDKRLEDVLPPDLAALHQHHLEQALRTNTMQVFQYAITFQQATYHHEVRLKKLNDDEVIGTLRDVTKQVQGQLALAASEQQMRAILLAMPDVIAQFNRQGVYLGDIHSGRSDNLIPLEQVQGKTFAEMGVLPADTVNILQAALEATFVTQEEHTHDYDIELNGNTYYRELRFIYLNERTCLGILRDITPWREMDIALQHALEHSTALLKEVHHRVRNNLQVLSSVLHLHAASLDDELAKRVLLENRRRVQTLALVHRVLYDNDSYAKIALDQYLASGVGLFAADMRRTGVVLELDTKSVYADLDHAIPFGLIVNELVNNVVRHAFVVADYPNDPPKATLQLSLYQQDNQVILQVIDNGVGLPKNFTEKQQNTLGMAIITSLSDQLAGTFAITNRIGTTGTQATLTFTC